MPLEYLHCENSGTSLQGHLRLAVHAVPASPFPSFCPVAQRFLRRPEERHLWRQEMNFRLALGYWVQVHRKALEKEFGN